MRPLLITVRPLLKKADIIIHTRCEFLLGILTIPVHSTLRNLSRNSWIQGLPKNVCYTFLYDNEESINEGEKQDGISLNSKYRGRLVRRGEKIFKFYSYVNKNEKFNNVKYIAKMDDDVVLCPELFQFLKNKSINTRSYAGMFWNLDKVKEVGISRDARSDEMFVILGRTLMNQIISKEYCNDTNEQTCDSLNQRFDTNFGGTSLGLWLSSIKDVDVHILPLNDVGIHGDIALSNKMYGDDFNNLGVQNSHSWPTYSKKRILLHHLTNQYNKRLSLIQQKYAQCRLSDSSYHK